MNKKRIYTYIYIYVVKRVKSVEKVQLVRMASKVHQVSFISRISISFDFSFNFILGPPGPPGSDGLPGGKLMNYKATIDTLYCFLLL